MSLNEVEGPREVKRDLPKQEPFVAKAPDSTPPVGAQKNFPVPNEITRSCLYDQTASCSLSRQKTELSVETRNGFQHTIKVLPLKCSNGGQRPNGRATAGCSKSVLKGTRTVSADGWTFLRTRPRHEIIVRQCGELIEKNASRILHETIDANKASKLIQFNAGVAPDSKSNGPPLNTVTIQYASYSLCSSLAISAKDAKNRASLECLKAFVEYFAVVKISAADATFVQSISHADFLSGAAIDQILCQVESPVCWKPNVHANFGYKIMHRFGWREGRGLGLRENGMIYAISTSAAQIGYNSGYGRPGLGFRDSSDQALIADRCEELCRIFLANAVLLEDMVFSSDFTLQEREVLHSVAEKYGLSHNSVGSGENRHIVIRYKWPSLSKLVEELRRVGGKTGRYELVEPQ